MKEICFQCAISIKSEQLVYCKGNKCKKSFHKGCAVQAKGLQDSVFDNCCGVHRTTRQGGHQMSKRKMIYMQ